jgi:phage tail protein X
MPHEVRVDGCPAGYLAHPGRPGEMVNVVLREFTSTEDGDRFVSRLEGIPRQLLAAIPGANMAIESTLDHMLAIVRPDQTATIYVNDLPFTIESRAKRRINAGQGVTADDIMDVTRLRLKGIVVPDDAGIVTILSAGWRKGLFFDFGPLYGKEHARTYEIEAALGHCYAYLHFQHLLAIPNAVWDEFSAQQWFPFIALKQATIRRMIALASERGSIDAALDTAAADTAALVADQLEVWKAHPILAEHQPVFKVAHERFLAGDFISAVSILYPRIEGVMRSHHVSAAVPGRATQSTLAKAVTGPTVLRPHGNSLLLPHRFLRFLEEVYFADFDPKKPNGLSRHTVSHGVAPTVSLNRKGAVLGFLILLQIMALLPSPSKSP